ncbi:MAG: SPOR domain-containing protein [Bacteroidales bacterium]|jgi:cell division septation protein DedD|nr:SPOR domain-containing protein [Bacteroidales bacterium]
MNLYTYVNQLLKENDCVIVPQFGGFIANYFEAKIDLKNQEFFPPSRKIAFNESLKSNDGLLYNYLCSTKNLTWESAEEYVKKFVLEITGDLNEGKTVEFGQLGKFTKKSEILTFIPNDKLNLLEDSFGLAEFNFPLLKSDKTHMEHNTQMILSKTKSAKLNKAKKSSRPLWTAVSVAAVLGGIVGISVFFDLFDTAGIDKNYSKVVPVEVVVPKNTDITDTELSQNAEEFNINSEEPILVSEEPEKADNIITEKVELEVITESPADQHLTNEKILAHTIAGSFANYSNAENMQSDLKSKGFDSMILPIHKGLYRVTLKSYADRKTAVKELESLRNQLDNSNMWVLYL